MWWFTSAILAGALVLGVSSGVFTNAASPQRQDRQTVSPTAELTAAAQPTGDFKASRHEADHDGDDDAFANLFEQTQQPGPGGERRDTHASPATALEVTGARVNLRAEPSLDAPRLARYRKGTRLELLRSEGAWKRVRNPVTDEAGWISGEFLTEAHRPRSG